MSLKPILKQKEIENNLTEKKPAYSEQEAITEAERCLYCFDAPCIMGCPTGIDIPAFIKKVAQENYLGSAKTILESNLLGASCARVCPTEVLCEGACVMEDHDKNAIKIGKLQRFATDYFYKNGHKIKPTKDKSNKKIAVIGAGPAGLACAGELAKLGHNVTIFEKKKLAGGLNTYGVAYYKMSPQASLEEIEMIKNIGVEIKCDVEVGKDISAEDLQNDFNAVFIGIGLGKTYQLGIKGENLEGVVDSLDFIEDMRSKKLDKVKVGKRVAVIGCGNTAIDAVVQAKKLGALESTIIYRRDEKHMPAYYFEYELAKKSGCSFIFNAIAKEVIGEKGVTGLRLQKTKIDSNGKAVPIDGSEFELPFDMVITALGQEKQKPILTQLFPDLKLNTNGTIVTDEESLESNIKNIYAGGDAVNGGAEVVNAVAHGMRAARHMHEKFTGEKINAPVQTTRLGNPGNKGKTGRTGEPFGSGYNKPVRVLELEKEFLAKTK